MDLFKNFLTWDLSGEVLSSLLAMLIVLIFWIIVGILARFHNPLKKTKGLLMVGEVVVNYFDSQVKEVMGIQFKGYTGFIVAIASYLFVAFIFGLTGLPSPMTNLAVPLSLGFIAFSMIHITSIRYKKWRYFKRYIEPIPVFLPVNLLSMWSPLISLSFRLFGNAIAGWVLMSLIYQLFSGIPAALIQRMGEAFSDFSLISPIATPLLHAYFDLFSGFIQTIVFVSLTMVQISLEGPDEEDLLNQQSLVKGGK